MFKPVVKSAPPSTKTGSQPKEDIAEATAFLLAHRDQECQVAEAVVNPNRWFDALKAQGAKVVTRSTGKLVKVGDKERMTYDVYALIPAGEVKPHLKPSARR